MFATLQPDVLVLMIVTKMALLEVVENLDAGLVAPH